MTSPNMPSPLELPAYSPSPVAFPSPGGILNPSSPILLAPHEYMGLPVINGVIPLTLQDYDPSADVQKIYKATHGMGTRDEKLVKALLGKTSMQAQVLAVAYEHHTQKNLVSRIIDETSDVYQIGLIMLAKGLLGGDAYLLSILRDRGKDSRQAILTDILIGRTKEDIDLLENYISATHQSELRRLVFDAVPSGRPFVKEVFEAALSVTAYSSSPVPDYEEDYNNLDACVKGANISDSVLLEVLLNRPLSHLYLVYQYWRHKSFNNSMEAAVAKHFSDKPDAARILKYAITGANTQDGKYALGIWRDALKIDESLSKKEWLNLTVYLVRLHWDCERFQRIIAAVNGIRQGNDGTLLERIKGARKSLMNPAGANGDLIILWREIVQFASS